MLLTLIALAAILTMIISVGNAGNIAWDIA